MPTFTAIKSFVQSCGPVDNHLVGSRDPRPHGFGRRESNPQLRSRWARGRNRNPVAEALHQGWLPGGQPRFIRWAKPAPLRPPGLVGREYTGDRHRIVDASLHDGLARLREIKSSSGHVALLLGLDVTFVVRNLAELPGKVDPDQLAGHAGRGVHVKQRVPLPSTQVRLLKELALRGRQWRLTGFVQQPGRQLPKLPLNRMSVLANQHDAILFVQRNDSHRTWVHYYVATNVHAAVEQHIVNDERPLVPLVLSGSTQHLAWRALVGEGTSVSHVLRSARLPKPHLRRTRAA